VHVHHLHQKHSAFSVVKLSLAQFATDPEMIEEIKRLVPRFTRLCYQVSRFLNWYFLRLFANNPVAVLPPLNQTFFLRAFTLVAGSTSANAVAQFGKAYDDYQAKFT
jgi:hypothetical protein